MNNTLNTGRKIVPAKQKSIRNKSSKKVDASDLLLQLPRHEQDHLASMLSNIPESIVQKYVMSLVSPKSVTCRLPDSFNRLTSVVQSISIIDVPIYFGSDNGTNNGRFSLLVQPHLGSLLAPAQYAIAMSDGSEPWPQNWSAAGSYAALVNGKDVRLDPNFRTLTQSPLLSAVYSSVAANRENALPFGDGITKQSGYGQSVIYRNDTGNFYPGTGLYLVSIELPTTGTPEGTVSITSAGGAVVSAQFSRGSEDYSATWTGYVNFPYDGSEINISLQPGGATLDIALPSYISFVSTFDDDSSLIPTANRGLITQYRPVSCSVLATYLGPEIVNGGMIASAYCPGSTATTNYFAQTNPSIVGSLQNWENLAQLPGAYNGPLRDGTYCYWTPESYEDTEFESPDSVVQSSYPTLVVSGQYLPGDSAPSTPISGVVRVEVVRNIELETTSTLFEKAKCVGSQAYMDLANKILSDEFHSMPNKSHLAFLDRIWNGLKSGAGFLWKNRKPILAAAEMAAPLFL